MLPQDLRVRIPTLHHYTYPDIVVVCGTPILEDLVGDTLLNPTRWMEVLSDSTEKYDRGTKSPPYRTIPSLQAYLLVSQDRVYVEYYERFNECWVLKDYQVLADRIPLPSLECELAVAHIYEDVNWEKPLSPEK